MKNLIFVTYEEKTFYSLLKNGSGILFFISAATGSQGCSAI